MKDTDHLKSHDEFASTYDSQVKEYNSYSNEVLFGMCFEYIEPGESLLDLGLGTGLSSVHLARFGLEVTGLDGSEAMLNECRKKSFAKELKRHNIQQVPLPYLDRTFSHIICCGVFHFFGNLLLIIKDSFRILQPGGIFAFTFAAQTAKEKESFSENLPDYIETPSAWGISIFKHSDEYIHSIAEELGLTILKEQKVLIDSGDNDTEDILFKVIVMQKNVS